MPALQNEMQSADFPHGGEDRSPGQCVEICAGDHRLDNQKTEDGLRIGPAGIFAGMVVQRRAGVFEYLYFEEAQKRHLKQPQPAVQNEHNAEYKVEQRPAGFQREQREKKAERAGTGVAHQQLARRMWVSINVTNCTDGVDGLCGSLSIVSALSFYVVFTQVLGNRSYGQLTLLMIICLLGYLWFNASPSKLLMGSRTENTGPLKLTKV